MAWKLDNHYSKTILDNLITFKTANNLKQKDFIRILGVTKGKVSNIFNSKANITTPMLMSLKQKYPEIDLNIWLS